MLRTILIKNKKTLYLIETSESLKINSCNKKYRANKKVININPLSFFLITNLPLSNVIKNRKYITKKVAKIVISQILDLPPNRYWVTSKFLSNENKNKIKIDTNNCKIGLFDNACHI